jgi:hypothetical protein
MTRESLRAEQLEPVQQEKPEMREMREPWVAEQMGRRERSRAQWLWSGRQRRMLPVNGSTETR